MITTTLRACVTVTGSISVMSATALHPVTTISTLITWKSDTWSISNSVCESIGIIGKLLIWPESEAKVI
jgi:hypothetical protein